MLCRARHRVGQFAGALRPRVDADARTDAYIYLESALQRVFETMTLRDQQHGIDVMRRVRASAAGDGPLLAAALLHDCGKGDLRLWQRVAHVLLGAAPAFRRRIASEYGAAWRQAMWRLMEHPRLGAEMAAAAGADPEIVRLIHEQESTAPDARLALLQAADDA